MSGARPRPPAPGHRKSGRPPPRRAPAHAGPAGARAGGSVGGGGARARRPRPRRRSKLGPVGWFLLLMLGGYALVTALFYWLMTAQGEMFPLLFVVFIAYDFVIYLVYFWIGVYLVVELQLWRHTRNEGHLLQFLGALLVLAPISWGLSPSAPSNRYGIFGPAGLALSLLDFVSFSVGAGMSL